MSLLVLRRLPTFGSVRSVAHVAPPVKDSTNPGSSSPARQGAKRLSVDQTTSVSIASASSVNSDGQVQLPALHPSLQGLNVSHSGSMARSFSGERMRSRAVSNTDQGIVVTEGRGGLPRNVFPGNQNVSRPTVDVAETSPIATNHDGGRRAYLSGIPTPVAIR